MRHGDRSKRRCTVTKASTSFPGDSIAAVPSGGVTRHLRFRERVSRKDIAAAAIITSVVVANAVWVLTQRRGQPMDNDEAGYIDISLRDYLSLHRQGPVGWLHEIVVQPVQAPLAPALASLIHWVSGPRVLNAYLISLLSYGVLLACAYALVRKWSGTGRLLTLTFVAGAPVILQYSRSFHFAEIASACLALVLLCQQRSLVFTRTLPAVGWGISLGLLVLARTMTIAFVPGLLLAALLPVLARRSVSGLVRVGAGLATAVVVASTWYVYNAAGVYDYLWGDGYGPNASLFGAKRSVFSPSDWLSFGKDMNNAYFFAGMASFIVAGWLLTGGICVWRASTALAGPMTWRERLERVGVKCGEGNLVVLCGITSVCGVLALMSSGNQGSGFIAPLVLPLVVVAAWGYMHSFACLRANGRRWFALAGAGLFGLFAGAQVAVLAVSDVTSFLPSDDRVVSTVARGSGLSAWNSESNIERFEIGGQVPTALNPLGPRTGRAWLTAWARIDSAIYDEAGRSGRPLSIMLTFRDRLLTIPQLQLPLLLRGRFPPPLHDMLPTPNGDTIAYFLHLEKPLDPTISMVMTATGGPDQAGEPLPADLGPTYARALHFDQVFTYRLPDGRTVGLWTPRVRLSAHR